MRPLLLLLPWLWTADADPVPNPNWYATLPACPCGNPDQNGVTPADGWARDKGNLAKYHPGAAACFRSYPAMRTAVGLSGQQCCYGADGRLIKSGAGAGTPDKVSTCAGEDKAGNMKLRLAGLYGHYVRDVRPWLRAGPPQTAWKTYNQTWVPNVGSGCD